MNPLNNKLSKGTTLIELMIAVLIMGTVLIGMVGAFGTLGKSLQASKSRTLASNLCQEQMQIMKQKSFNKILVTTATYMYTEVTPNIPYDNGYYPPESISEGGIRFTRYTYVQVADEDSGSLEYFGAIPDTGMKALTVSVVWSQGTEKRKVQMRNIVSNIDTTMTNAVFRGQVTRSGPGTPIQGASISIAENVGYSDNSDASGNYSINLSPGNYYMYVTADGYFPQSRYVSIGANTSQVQDFPMVMMGSGTIRGTAWITDHLVISQVVGSTINSSGFCQEYVEVFNPTTFTWTINGNIDLGYIYFPDSSPTFINMNYTVDTVGPGAYYLFSNTSPVTAAGISRTADAVFQDSNAGYPDIIRIAGADPCGAAAGNADLVGIAWRTTGEPIDLLGWTQNPREPDSYEGTPLNQGVGLQDGEQFVRRTSTTGVTTSFGRSYDSNNNNVDFVSSSPILYPPRNSSDIETIVAGTPAYGAYVTATDGLSQMTTAYAIGDPPYAEFRLISVATGTWTVFITSGNYTVDISSVIVVQNSTTSIPNSISTPTWPSSNYYSSILSEIATGGYITGWVKNALNAAITPSVTVRASGSSGQASTTNGTYFLSVSSGTLEVTANPSNQNTSYVSASSQGVVVNLGQVYSDVNFILSQGGRIRGFVTRDGTNALPGVALAAFDSNGVARDEEVTGVDGRYTLTNLSTGTYYVEPILGSGETSTPSQSTVTVTAGSLVSAATFTITGAFGNIRGSVTLSSSSIRTGVLIVCSTSSLSAGPPALNTNTLTGAGYYITNSYEDGTYALEVRGSTTTTYNLAAYYTVFSGNNPVISTRTASNISVTAGATTSGVNFTW